MTYRPEWNPNVGVGGIIFGEPIQKYIDDLGVYLDEDDEPVGTWIRYIVPGIEMYVDVENDKVVSVNSFENFFYRGVNLIGSNIEILKQLLPGEIPGQGETVEYDDGDIQTVFDYDLSSLQVWCRDDGTIVSVSCCNYDTEN